MLYGVADSFRANGDAVLQQNGAYQQWIAGGMSPGDAQGEVYNNLRNQGVNAKDAIAISGGIAEAHGQEQNAASAIQAAGGIAGLTQNYRNIPGLNGLMGMLGRGGAPAPVPSHTNPVIPQPWAPGYQPGPAPAPPKWSPFIQQVNPPPGS